MLSPKWIALTREAAIAGQSISAGLGALRSANYATTGLYSHAFFSLSIGLERLLKILFLIDHALHNEGSYPSDKELKDEFGHDLVKLFSRARKIHESLPSKDRRYAFSSGGIEDDIISFLSKFAKTTRYYNLNYLGSASDTDELKDPIREWFERIGKKVFEKHYSMEERRIDAEHASAIQQVMGNYALVRHTAEDGSPIASLEDGALQTGKNKKMQKYGTFYCVKIVRFLYMILYDLVREAHSKRLEIPYLDELFFPFMNDDKYLLSRKTFPPRGQGR